MNVDWIQYLPASARRTAYFGLQELGGFRITAAWQDFREWTRFSQDQLKAAVDCRLLTILDASIHASPHYQKLGLVRKPHESAEQFLQRFPVLTREQIRSEFRQIITRPLSNHLSSPSSVAAKSNDWLVVKTGGTTGTPTAVVHDIKFRNAGRATRLASQGMCGFPLGTRYFRLWGSEQDLLQQNEKLDRRVLRNLLGEIPLNAFRAKEAEMLQHWQTLHANPQVKNMMAYVDAAVSLASFIRDRQLEPPKLRTIMACAGTVTPEWRAILSETFSAEVFDKYGSRECSDIACECDEHSGLHIFLPNVFVEVVNDQNMPCKPDETGRILVTLLNNFAFPMIRYEIGDLGTMGTAEPCACGLAFPRLRRLEGRRDDMLTTSDGTLLSSVFVRHFVGVSLNRDLIREWQLEQTSVNRFIFRYIPLQESGLQANLDQLKTSFLSALGTEASITFCRVEEIPLTATGKVRWIINHCRK